MTIISVVVELGKNMMKRKVEETLFNVTTKQTKNEIEVEVKQTKKDYELVVEKTQEVTKVAFGTLL